MKKILLILAVAAIALPSCKKDYTCVCTDDTGQDTPESYKYTKVKKKDAEASCKKQDEVWAQIDYSCKLD